MRGRFSDDAVSNHQTQLVDEDFKIHLTGPIAADLAISVSEGGP